MRTDILKWEKDINIMPLLNVWIYTHKSIISFEPDISMPRAILLVDIYFVTPFQENYACIVTSHCEGGDM